MLSWRAAVKVIIVEQVNHLNLLRGARARARALSHPPSSTTVLVAVVLAKIDDVRRVLVLRGCVRKVALTGAVAVAVVVAVAVAGAVAGAGA